MRDSELTRASAVLACKDDGNIRGMIRAAATFWLEPPERPDPPDEVATDVWRAIVEAGAIEPAVEMGLRLCREGQLIRPCAFIDLSENVTRKADLVELAELVIAHGWATYPYLGAVFMRLIENQHTTTLFELIQKHRQALYADPETWLLVAFVLTTSQVGHRADVEAWFEGHEERAVPMWIRAAYTATFLEEALTWAKLSNMSLARLVALARKACDTPAWDETAAYFVYWLLIDDLRHGREGEFLAGMQQHRELLERHATASPLDHPVVRYANGLKHQHAVSKADLEYRRYLGTAYTIVGAAEAAADGRRPRPLNWQLTELVADLGDLIDAARRILDLFPVMHALEPGDPQAAEMMRVMLKARPSALPWLKQPWGRLVKARVPWAKRVRFAMFS